jgi:hypothetical protein
MWFKTQKWVLTQLGNLTGLGIFPLPILQTDTTTAQLMRSLASVGRHLGVSITTQATARSTGTAISTIYGVYYDERSQNNIADWLTDPENRLVR